MTMLEKQRLTYLDNLGITSYMPRRLLPHAAPSQLLSDELLQEPTAFSTADMVVDQVDTLPPLAESKNSVMELLSDSPSQRGIVEDNGKDNQDSLPQQQVNTVIAEQEEQLANDVTAELEQASAKPLKFTLHIWKINHSLLVVDSHQPGAALPTDRLLQNILRSVGYPLAQLPQSELLRWPLFSGAQFAGQIDQNEQAEARAMVQAYMDAQCTKSPLKAILLLGEEATNFVLASGKNDGSCFAQYQGMAIEQPQWQTTALVAPSLIEMLNEPIKKRVTWQALQFLLAE